MPTKNTKTSKKNTKDYTYAVGRRKNAIARVRVYQKKDKSKDVDITVNQVPVGKYFHTQTSGKNYSQPLKITNTLNKFSVTAKISGSGISSQQDALVHGISRALVKIDESYRPLLKKKGFLTRDPRKKQRRMIGTGGKARRQKQSPKR